MKVQEFIHKFRIVDQKSIGVLSFLERGTDIPFEIKRIFYIYDVPKNVTRGGHAHRKLDQVLFCPCGEVGITLDDGIDSDSLFLDDPSTGLLVKRGIWHSMIWKKKNSVLISVASDIYREEDYIRNYDEFLELVRQRYWP